MIDNKYEWGAISPSDPIQTPLKFHTKDKALAHANLMNLLIPICWNRSDSFFNKEYWKTRPEPWIVFQLN